MIQNTSAEAYNMIRNHLSEKQDAVYQVLEQALALTDEMISRQLEWPINRVTPRRGELVKLGLVEVAFEAKTATGYKAKFWRIKTRRS